MKRLVIFLLCITLIIASLTACSGEAIMGNSGSPEELKDSPNFLKANSGFAFDVLKQLNKEDKGQNIFISPLSISTALSMTYQGANGTTKAAMAKALRYDNIDIKELNTGYKNLLRYLEKVDKGIELNIGNSIWIREGEKIKDSFLASNKDNFDAKVAELDFSKEEAADRINKWISDSTKGKIQEMIEPPISQQVIMYLINAIYFKGEWTNQFEKGNTFDADFYSEDGKKKTVKMMSRTGKVELGEGDGYKAVRLPYGKGKIAMYCILPNEGVSINSFIKDIDSNKWEEIKKNISEKHEVILQIPRFKIEYGVKKLNDSLSELGMGEAFSDKADFSGIRNDVYISRVLHKAVVEVNEEGSEAAGVTVVEVKETAAILEPPSFIANRPFIFIISDDETDSILFEGKYANAE